VTASRDELHRQLRASELDHRAAMPAFARALRRAVDPSGGADPAATGALLGIPTNRRGFLRVGGMSVAAGAILVGCSSKKKEVTITGELPDPEPTPYGLTPSEDLDLTLVRTASSIEALAIASYDAVLTNGWLGDPALDEVATLFRGHHQDHLDVLTDVADDLGGEGYDQPNPFLQTNVIDPAVAKLAEVEGAELRLAALGLAYTLENTAAQTYTRAAGLLTTAELRQGVMAIGASEARHITVLLTARNEPAVPFAVLPIGAAVGESAFVAG
jgi:hypothetical protein